uniref:Signal peptide, CUB and EGF-like domain-containing protein 1 n=1 Tax=Strigamia maritima TaxID=126957 RepID=T1JDQ5_STRMM
MHSDTLNFITLLAPVFFRLFRCDTVDIDLQRGVVRGYNPFVSFVSSPVRGRGEQCSRQAVIRLDLSGNFKIAIISLDYDERPRQWTLDIAESNTADGHGGNVQYPASEFSVHNRQVRLYSNGRPGYRSATIDGGYLLKVIDGVVKQGSRLSIEISPGKVSWAVGGRREDVESSFVFQTSVVFAAFNRVVGGSWRNGTGICRATVNLRRTPPDECLLGTHQCDVHATCKNTRRAYRCRCKPGYQGDGKKCQDRNECSVRNGGCVHKCHNNPGNFTCSCHDGFQLDKDGRNCIDIDECSKRKGGCVHQCLNTLGSYECRCNDGFSLAADGHSCNMGSWCKEQGCDHSCEVTRSSFICTCRPGFMLAPDGRNCIQSCSHGNGGCQHRCTHTSDGPICTCHYKYILGLDKKSCSPSCAINNGGCDRKCSTTPQGMVKCNCPNGFLLHKDGRSCLDIDECAVKNGGCSHTCLNSHGSFECICPEGYKLLPNEKTCSEFDECSISGTCDHTCVNTPGSYECVCNSGYEQFGQTHCGDKNECAQNNGGCHHLCVNTEGSFKCACRQGYFLHPNKKDCIEMDTCKDDEAANPIQVQCRRNKMKETCSLVCASGLHFSGNRNESYRFECGSRSTNVCMGNTCSLEFPRRIKFTIISNGCHLLQRITGHQMSSRCISVGIISYVKMFCEPRWKPRWSRDLTEDHTSIIHVDMDVQLGQKFKTSSCNNLCREKYTRQFRYVMAFIQRQFQEELFYVTSPREKEFLLMTSRTNDTVCPDGQIYLHGKCVFCSAGNFFDLDKNQCIQCPSGTYQDSSNQFGCHVCPQENMYASPGSSSLSTCGSECLPGYYSADGFQPCTLCPLGKYQPQTGRMFCHVCGKGINSLSMGSTSFHQCQVPEFCTLGSFYNTSIGQCQLCPIGFYQPNKGRDFCFACPGETATDYEGSSDLTQCKSRQCGGSIGKLLGIFESPNYPGNYPNNIQCTWTIRAQKGRRILVVVPQLFLADDQCGDSLVMRKSKSPYSITTYDTCKTQQRPIAFTARSRKLWIHFKSDGKNNDQGFRIPYALFNEEYQPLIESIVRDSQLYAMINHQEILKDRKLLTALMDVIAHPINYYKYANISWAWFPDSFVRFIMSKVKFKEKLMFAHHYFDNFGEILTN